MVKGFKFFKYNDINSLKKLLSELKKNDQKVSGILIEPIQGEGGVIPGDKIFFKELREICNQNNSLLILDEVQSGVGSCLLYTSPSPRDVEESRMPSSA